MEVGCMHFEISKITALLNILIERASLKKKQLRLELSRKKCPLRLELS